MKEEFASFVGGLDDYSDISTWDLGGGFVMEQMLYICRPLPFIFFHKWQALHRQKGIGAPMVLFIM